MNRKQGIGMFTRRAVTSSRIECGKEKTHHRHTLHSQSNAKRNKFKSPNRCFMCVQQNLIRFEIFSGWFVEPHLRAHLCLWKSNDSVGVVVGAQNVFLSSLTHSYSCVHTTKAIPCSSFPLIPLLRWWWRERDFTFFFIGDPASSTRMRNFYGSKFLVMNAAAVWGDLKGTIVCLTLAHWHPERVHSLAAALLPLIGDDKILIELYCLLSIRNPCLCNDRAFNFLPLPVLVAAEIENDCIEPNAVCSFSLHTWVSSTRQWLQCFLDYASIVSHGMFRSKRVWFEFRACKNFSRIPFLSTLKSRFQCRPKLGLLSRRTRAATKYFRQSWVTASLARKHDSWPAALNFPFEKSDQLIN